MSVPKHLWVVGGIAVLWNSFGCYDYWMTQTANADYLAMFTPEQRAYFNSFPVWMEAAWAFGVWGALAGSVLLLMRKAHAVTAFIASLAGLALSTLWQFGLSGVDMAAVFGSGPMIMTAIIWVIAIGLLLYSRKMKADGHLT